MIKIKKKQKDSGYLIPIYKKDKKGIEMSFNWIFALFAGGFILFLAIFAASRLISTGGTYANTLTSTNFVSILDTWEAGIASGVKPGPLIFKTETKLNFRCYDDIDPPFGKETVSSSDVLFNGQYSKEGEYSVIKNKYVFTEQNLKGKKFYTFSTGFYMPFKIADLIMFSDQGYCFYDAPNNVKRDIEPLRIANIEFANSSRGCDGSGVKVCFGSRGDCDITVSIAGKYVIKDDRKLYYHGSLLYAAIFSSPEIYECNVKRLMGKFGQLGAIYVDKIKIMERKKCSSNVGPKLNFMILSSGNLTNSGGLKALSQLSDELDSINNGADPGCKLYKNEEKY